MALTKISTGGVKDDAASQAKIADEAVDEARLQISNAGTNGQFLQKQSGNTGGLTWSDVPAQYTHPNHSGEVTSTADGAQVIADNVVDEANLKVSNTPTNGQLLSAQSGNTGGLTWTDPPASSPQFEATASGAITAGKPVIINSNGTVTQVAESYTDISTTKLEGQWHNAATYWPKVVWDDSSKKGIVTWTPQSNNGYAHYASFEVSDAGITSNSSSGFLSPDITWHDTAWDPVNNRIIAFASAKSPNNDLRARVGRITGNTVTWGTEYQVENNTGSGLTASYNGSGKFVLTWKDNSNNYKGCVATLGSGSSYTTLTFGSIITIQSSTGSGGGTRTSEVDDNGKHITLWSLTPAGSRYAGFAVKMCVLSVSGTTLSAGSAVYIEGSDQKEYETGSNPPICVFDSDQNKFLLAFEFLHGGNNDQTYYQNLLCRNLSISGTSITASSSSTITTTNISEGLSGAYDPNKDRFVVYWTTGTDLKETYVTISGTSAPTIGTTNTTADVGNALKQQQSLWLPSLNRSLIISKQDGSSYGKMVSFQYTSILSNLTNSNFIGLAASSVSSGATATIDVTGATNTGVSGLTVGSNYYVLGSGALSTSGSTFAGKAVAANKLIVDYLKPSGSWEVVSTHVLTGTTSDIGWTGWSSDYAQYKVVFSGCYNSDQNLMRIRFYTDSTSGNTGSLVTSSAYKRTGLKTTYGSTTYTVDAGTSSYFYPQVASFGTETNNGELIFPMKTSGHTGPHQCYGEWLGHADHWSNLTCELDANTTHILTGIHIYFTANNSLTAKAPTSGRVTLLRMKV